MADLDDQLASITVTHGHLICGGRRVPLRRTRWGGTNITEAVVVLGVDLGLPAVRHFKHARRKRLMLTATAAALLALGPEDDPGRRVP